MAKQDKNPRSGFVIKLSNETALKLAEEEKQAKSKAEEAILKANDEVKSKDVILDAQNATTNTPAPKEKVSESVKKESSEQVVSKNEDTKDGKGGELQSENSSKASEVAAKSGDVETGTASGSWGAYAPYITYEGEEAIYTDPTSKQRYNWSQETNSWVAKESDANRVYSYENDTHVYTDADGSKCFWDDEKKAWIPKVDDDFLAFYQMSYGFIDNKSTEKKDDETKEVQKKPDGVAGVKRKNDPQWFEPSEDKNTKVYVSNLPSDLNEEEFINFMQKCGLVERDPHTQKMKVKMYMDKEHNCFKGDALCTYIKIESVDLALNLLDGSDLKGNKVKVEKAQFELKGEYNPALKPKKKKKKELEKIKKMQQKLFDWRPEKFIGERSKHERVVILKNLFHPTDFDKEVQLILDYQQDLREEATKSGEVRKVVLYDRHPEGVAQITMKEPEQADAVVELMNGRWFGKRQITAEIWDGRTKYRIAETDADIGKRIDKWEKFLEEKDDEKKAPEPEKQSESSTVSTDVAETATSKSSDAEKVVNIETSVVTDTAVVDNEVLKEISDVMD